MIDDAMMLRRFLLGSPNRLDVIQEDAERLADNARRHALRFDDAVRVLRGAWAAQCRDEARSVEEGAR